MLIGSTQVLQGHCPLVFTPLPGWSVHVTFYCSESDLKDILFHFQVSPFIPTTLLPLRGIPPPHPHVRKAGGKMREDERRSGHERNRNRVHVLSALCCVRFPITESVPAFVSATLCRLRCYPGRKLCSYLLQTLLIICQLTCDVPCASTVTACKLSLVNYSRTLSAFPFELSHTSDSPPAPPPSR